MGLSVNVEAPRIAFEGDELHIQYPRLFGHGGEAQARRFVRRAFAFPEVHSIDLQCDTGKAVVGYRVATDERKPFLAALAAAMGGAKEGWDDAKLPRWNAGEAVTLHRFGELASTFEILQIGPTRLQFRHGAIIQDPTLGRRIENAVKAVRGVREATATVSTAKLWVSYQPDVVDIVNLVRVAEGQLALSRNPLATYRPVQNDLRLANATLGLAAVGEFALPVVMPVCVGILVASNLNIIRDAGRQLSQGKLGLPVVYTALLGCSITTGQIVAHALMEWSFRFWAGRTNAALGAECRTLFEETLPIPTHARLVRSDEVDAQVPSEFLVPGHRFRVAGCEALPADGRVVSGNALVDETSVTGARTPVRKTTGDEVFAGSTLLAGNLEVEVMQIGPQTQAARIARSVINGVRNLTRDEALRRRSRSIAERAAPPTLAVAGLGWMVGDLFTVGAILHQDHASGPSLAVPLETLRSMRHAMCRGALVKNGNAMSRLSESRFVVLDDHPAWKNPVFELEALDSRLKETEGNNLLRHVAGAAFYLGDERSQALANACSRLGLVVRVPSLISMDADKIAVRQGQHTIILRNSIGAAKTDPLTVEIDGQEVAKLNFRRGEQLEAALAVQQLKQKGMQVFLLSSRPAADTEDLARRLQTDLHSGDFDRDEKIRFLRGLRRRGVLATHIGNGRIDPELAREAHVSVSLGGISGLASEEADIVLPGGSLDTFVEVVELAKGYHERIGATCRHAVLPNLLCIAGGFAGALNGISAGVLANVGVFNVYRQATGSSGDSQQTAVFNSFKRASA